MGLRLKFNLMLVAVFAAGISAIGVVAQRYMENQAIDDAQRAALTILDTVGYGSIDPRIASGLGSRLVDMKVREYGADENNSGIEAQVATRLKATPSGQIADVMTTPGGERRLAVARTTRTADAGTLRIRLAVIDLAPVLANANNAFISLMSSIGAVFLAVFVVLNIMLDRMIVRPVAEMSRQADAVSIGDFSIAEFMPRTKDEIGVLAIAFNRMRRSTEEAIKLLKAG